MVSKTLPYLAVGLVVGSQSTWAGPIPRVSTKADVDVNVDVHKRSLLSNYRFTHPYTDRTPCWVEGRRGWVKDQTCTDLVEIDASVHVGKRHHSFDDPYFVDGTPCFHHGREGIVEDLLCVDLDLDIGEHYPDSDYYGPWYFSHAYDDGRPCWVDHRRGWVHDGACGDLLELDADVLLDKRFYKDDPYFFNGVPCVKDGREGVITDYLCIVAEVTVNKRGLLGHHGHKHELIDGAPCWDNGREGVVNGLLCVVADVSLGKFSHAGPTDGMACRFNGRWGRYRNAVCIDADVDVAVRSLHGGHGLIGGLVDSVTGGDRYYPHGVRPSSDVFGHYREEEAIDVDAAVDVKRDIKTGNIHADIKAKTDAEVKLGHRHSHDVTLKSDAQVKANVKHGRGLYKGDSASIDATLKASAKVDVRHRSFRVADKAAVAVKSDIDINADLKPRGGDGDLLGSAIGSSVQNLGKSVDNALDHGKRDLLRSDDLLDLESAVDITGTGYGRHHRNKAGLLGGVVRRAPVAQPGLLNGLGLGGKRKPARGKGKGKLLGAI